MKEALVVWGGWAGHEPELGAGIVRGMLEEEGFKVYVENTTEAFADPALNELSLIVPIYTMSKIEKEELDNLTRAVQGGVGLAGYHGGMCDAFRDNADWLFLTGGQFAAHPGNDGTKYRVHIGPNAHPITAGIQSFDVSSEQYYMLVDPANNVLAYTDFPNAPGDYAVNGPTKMPTIWTRQWGKGRVFYSALGHHADIVEAEPHLTIMRRGFKWAATGKV